MGANGSHASGVLESIENRKYYTLFKMADNVIVLGQKSANKSGKLPEESHTPNRVYVSFMADGSDVKEIAQYGDDGKKLYAIHTLEHRNRYSKECISPHYHIWKNGSQSKEGYPLTKEMQQLLTYVRQYGCK